MFYDDNDDDNNNNNNNSKILIVRDNLYFLFKFLCPIFSVSSICGA